MECHPQQSSPPPKGKHPTYGRGCRCCGRKYVPSSAENRRRRKDVVSSGSIVWAPGRAQYLNCHYFHGTGSCTNQQAFSSTYPPPRLAARVAVASLGVVGRGRTLQGDGRIECLVIEQQHQLRVRRHLMTHPTKHRSASKPGGRSAPTLKNVPPRSPWRMSIRDWCLCTCRGRQ